MTDGWDSPPGWVWSANSRDVYIACWGPQLAMGAIVALVGRRPEPRWCGSAGRVDPNDPNSAPRVEPMTVMDWSHPDRIVGYNRQGQVLALDAKTGQELWLGVAHPPISFAPDGGEFAMHTVGIVYYDAATGLPNGKLPMHLGAESLIYSRDGARLAAVVQPGNRWGAEAGIFIYDRGEYRYSPDVPPLPEGGRYAFSWRPDGQRAAITGAGRLQIWELGAAPVKQLDMQGEGHPSYGAGVLVTYTQFGLAFRRESDGAVIGEFEPATEASGESPLAGDGEDVGARWTWNPAFPIDRVRVAVALPEGVVIGPPEARASVAEIDAKIAWIIDRKWAWPWRWGETKVWPDVETASLDRSAPALLKRKFGKRSEPAAARAKKVAWPPPGGTLDDIAAMLAKDIQAIGDTYHGSDYRRRYAISTMALGLFDRAAAAIDGGAGWEAWSEPWAAALARCEAAMTAMGLTGSGEGGARTEAQMATLRRWLEEAETALKEKAVKAQPLCRPQAAIGAGWILLGEDKRGEKLLATAIRTIDPENNASEHRRAVADALTALGRIQEAIEHLTSGAHTPSWTQTRGAIAAICPRASVAELQYLLQRMKQREAHEEFVLLNRGLARLIALRAWDVAAAWPGEFAGLSTRTAEIELATAMVAGGEAGRAEAMLMAGIATEDGSEYLLGLARALPGRAGGPLVAMVAAARQLLESAYYPLAFLGHVGRAAALLGRLDLAAQVEALARGPAEKLELRLAVLAALDPGQADWGTWFARARAEAPDSHKAWMQLAAQASRGGLSEVSGELLDRAIEAVRSGESADIRMMEVMAAMTAVGDLAGAHRALMALPKGQRSHRNAALIAACEARGLWAAALEILRTMPKDVNGGPQRGLRLLATAAGQVDW